MAAHGSLDEPPSVPVICMPILSPALNVNGVNELNVIVLKFGLLLPPEPDELILATSTDCNTVTLSDESSFASSTLLAGLPFLLKSKDIELIVDPINSCPVKNFCP